MSITVIIPSRRRPDVLHDTLTSLSAQTRPARRIIIAVPDVATDVAPATRRLPLPLLVEQAPIGTSAQRNRAIQRLGDDVEIVVFLDDDVELDRQYLEVIERFFRARPQAGLVTGEVLADGVRTGGVARADARRIVASEAARRVSATTRWQVEVVERAYGCNMALPRALLDRVGQFDENMPLYGWMEDLDFSYRCARHGPVLLCRDARMVHLGHASGGRRSGAGFGFSEIMNPLYLWRKGSPPLSCSSASRAVHERPERSMVYSPLDSTCNHCGPPSFAVICVLMWEPTWVHGMKLSARRVQTAGPGRHVDGRGLMLLVKPSGARSWVLRYQVAGKRHDLGLGPYPEISLAEARERALEERRRILAGRDPIAERKRAGALTFEAAAEALIESKRAGWRSAKHAAQWSATLRTYAYPSLGSLNVRRIDTAAVLEVLRPIWTAKPETASRVRQRIEAVLDYASAMGARDGENPARWRGHLANLLPKPSQVRAVRHHAALEWQDVPELMSDLQASDWPGSRALAFVMLTAARSGEVRGMRWREVDLEAAVWRVPAARIKAGKEHRVPLVPEAIALLGKPGDPDTLVFESPTKPERPLSDVTLGAVLKRLGRSGVTVHGLRSTFRDWAGETTAHPREVIEAALAHRLKDKAEAAYARGDLFQKRRRLMEDWAGHLLSGAPRTKRVVRLEQRAAG